jgi:phosphopantothenoylcysteine decarboxylase/phosphopantothenate--cysteine ligase
MTRSLAGKTVVLGVSASIAAYKAAYLLRLLMKEGADVYVVMSENAGRFVQPLTFEGLSGHPVAAEVFDTAETASMEHIEKAGRADALVIAPATAGTLGKLACGLAGDALANFFLAWKGPVVIAPAMNDDMYAHPAVQENIARLKARGAHFVDPEEGELACGRVGSGRLAEPAGIVAAVRSALQPAWDLEGLRFLVTAGPTREPIDPVRFISNPSSGKMGYAIAGQAQRRGAQVTLVSGPTPLDAPEGVRLLSCLRAEEMNTLVQAHLDDCDVLVMTSAVGDFSVETVEKEKIKKNGDAPLRLTLKPTRDILREVARRKTHQFVVGFAAETENLIDSAKEKLQKKDLDLIVGNDISAPGIGFQSDSNQVVVIDRAGRVEPWPLLTKRQIADRLLDRILQARRA